MALSWAVEPSALRAFVPHSLEEPPPDLEDELSEPDVSLPQALRARALASATLEMRAMLVIFTVGVPLENWIPGMRLDVMEHRRRE